MHTKKTNIKNQVHFHYKDLIEPNKLQIRDIFIAKKSYENL